jgi:hypothetical protein
VNDVVESEGNRANLLHKVKSLKRQGVSRSCGGGNAGKDLAREKDGIEEAESGFDHAMIFQLRR